MNQAKRTAIFSRWQAQNPQPTTELNYATPFQLLIAVILSAQSTDIGVNKATAKLFALAPDATSMLALGEKKLADMIKTLGLFRSKSKHVIATCQQLLDLHAGQVPATRAALEAMPGVGRKTANVILNTAFGQPTIAVDTHIFRIANRIGLARGKSPLAVENGLLKYTPAAFKQNAHHWLILHGRYVCRARDPQCARCLIMDLCEWKEKGDVVNFTGQNQQIPQ